MTTEHGPERRLSHEEELSVTKALRDLPAPPVPQALAARLDARLAELQAERASHASLVIGGHDPAARRRWPRVLLAAAAVLAGGYAVGAAVDGSLTGGSGTSDSTAEGSAGSTADTDRSAVQAPGHPAHQSDSLSLRAATLHRATLAADVRRLLRTAAPPRAWEGLWSPAGVAAPVGCRPPHSAAGSTVWLVRYDGAGAFLLTHPAGAERVHARLFTCHTGPSSGTATPPSPSPVPSSGITVHVPGTR